jgi:hypothetical protein
MTQTLGDFSSQYAVTSMGISRIPGHWIDSLQHEVRVALENSAGRPADSAEVGQAARALDLTVLPSDTTNWPLRSGSPPLPRLRLYRPGFNGDSTIAAVRYDYWCGPMCGAGETLLLARKPGHRWRIWYAFTHWIS